MQCLLGAHKQNIEHFKLAVFAKSAQANKADADNAQAKQAKVR